MMLDYRVKEIVTDNSAGFISGQPSATKTWFAWEIGVSVASGTPAFGVYKSKQGRVLAYNAEDDPATITRSRIAALAKAKGLQLSELDFHLINEPTLQLDQLETQTALLRAIQTHKPALLLFDPLRNLHSANEDRATEMKPILEFPRRIQREFGCSVLLVVHDRKPGKDDSRRASMTRGSNALEGWRDSAIYLDRDDEKTKVTIYHRGAQPPSPFYFRLETKTVNGQLDEAVLQFVDEGGAKHEAMEVLKKSIIEKVAKIPIGMTRDGICSGVSGRRDVSLNAINELIHEMRLIEIKNGRGKLLKIPGIFENNENNTDVEK